MIISNNLIGTDRKYSLGESRGAQQESPLGVPVIVRGLGIGLACALAGCADGRAGTVGEATLTESLSGAPATSTAPMTGPDPWVDVTAYGATASATCTDSNAQKNSTAIFAALSRLSAGGTLFLPAGTFCVAAPIVLSGGPAVTSAGAISIQGTGRGTIVQSAPSLAAGYVIQLARSYASIRHLAVNCASSGVSGIGLDPGTTGAEVQGNVVDDVLIESCTATNSASGAPPDAIALHSAQTTAGYGVTENSFHDVFITSNAGVRAGSGIHLSSAGGYVTDNEFSNVTINATPGANGVTLESGVSGNLFTNVVLGVGLDAASTNVNVSIASGANYNMFQGVAFDNDDSSAGPVTDVENSGVYTSFVGENSYSVKDTSGTMTAIGIDGASFGASHFGATGAALGPNTTLDLMGPAGANLPPAIAVGPRVQDQAIGVSSLATFNPPDVNGVLPALFVTDAVGRGPMVVTPGWNGQASTGNALELTVTDAGVTLFSVASGSGVAAPIRLVGSESVVHGGLVLQGSDGTCALLSVSGGAVVTTNDVACP